jgi:hypothetical protein
MLPTPVNVYNIQRSFSVTKALMTEGFDLYSYHLEQN